MTPSEQQLISGLFDRMRGFGSPEKDPEAEALIKEAVRQIPDAPYMLVQSVLVQEHALQQADQRIRELEARVNELESRAARAPAQQGGFLGGLFGGGARPTASPQRMGGSVPSAGNRLGSGPSGRSGPIGAPAGPLGQQPQAARAGGGSFLQSAMATAAGVAGGMLLANSISSMIGGDKSVETAKSGDETGQQAEQNQPQETADSGADENANLQDASYESDSADWGGDWGGGDFEI